MAHLEGVQHVLSYLQGTSGEGLLQEGRVDKVVGLL